MDVKKNIFVFIEMCPMCVPPAVETSVDPDECPICADWEAGPFGMVIYTLWL